MPRRTRPHLGASGIGRDFLRIQATARMDRSKTRIPMYREWKHWMCVPKGAAYLVNAGESCLSLTAHNHQPAQSGIGLLYRWEQIKDNAMHRVKAPRPSHPSYDAGLTACKPFPTECKHTNRCPDCIETCRRVGCQGITVNDKQ